MHLLKGGRVNTIAGSRKLENRAHPKATFYQSFLDKKNAMVPSIVHQYSAFMREVS